jgi:hypothetical protein
MFGFTRKIVRFGLLGALATGALVVIAGPERVGALFTQAKGAINDRIDKSISDPVALRAQLRTLEQEYPRRIAQAEADLREVALQLDQLSRQSRESELAAEMAGRDLETLQGLLAQAEQAQASVVQVSASGEPARRVEIVFADRRMTVDEAFAHTAEVNNVRTAYLNRTADIERDAAHLSKQKARLAALVEKLKGERNEFQVQLWQLDRQVDSIARNDRMIEVLSRRSASIDEQSRYRAASLDQINARVADVRARQESQLAALSAGEERLSYEQKARVQLETQAAQAALKDAATRNSGKANKKNEVIEIRALPGQPAPRPATPTAPPSPAAPANASPVG